MPVPYAGNPANYPEAVDIPGGSDVPTSSLFATAYEGEIDRSAWLRANLLALAINDATTPVTPFVQPGLGSSLAGPWVFQDTPAYDSKNRQWLVPYVLQNVSGGSALPGTYTLQGGLGAVIASSDPAGDISPGQVVVFSPQPYNPYTVVSVDPSGPSLLVTPPWTGTNTSTATATAPSLFTHLAFSLDGGRLFGGGPTIGAGVLASLALATAPASTPSAYQVISAGSNNRRWYNLNTLVGSAAATAANVTFATVFYFAAATEYVEVNMTQSGGSYTGGAYTATSSTAGGAPTDVHTSLPAGWQSGTATVTGLVSAVGNAVQNDAAVALQTSTASADKLLHVTFPSSTLTFTDVTPAFLTGSLHVTGLAYDGFNGLWGLLLSNGALYTTPDPLSSGSSWTQVATLTAGDGPLAVVSGVWCVGRTNPAAGSPQIWISADLPSGTATFHATDFVFPGGAGPMTLASSGTQLCAVAAGGSAVMISANLGYA